jgi:hypothetical protein
VTENTAEPDGTGLLQALGQVDPPDPGVLQAAREALWAAVSGEMLADGPAGGTGRTRSATSGEEDIPRGRAGPGR